MKLALYQGPSPAGDVAAAFGAIELGLAAAAAFGARMLVFPEVFLPGYNHCGVAGLAQAQDGGWHNALVAAVRRAGCGITVGYAEASGGRVYNSALVLDAKGDQLAHYRKVQLFGPREQAIFTSGDRLCQFEFEGRQVGVLICYDIEFAPHIRTLAERGVTLILTPTANMLPYTHVAEQTVPSQAVNHAVAIVYANYCGTEGDLDYCGGSVIVGRDGAVLARAGAGEAVLLVELDVPLRPGDLSSQIADYRKVE